MTRLRPTLPALAAALLFAALPAAAQGIESPFRYLDKTQGLEAWAGYLFTSPNLVLTDSTSAELGPQSAPMVGLRYQLRFTGPLSGEVGVAFAPSERKIYAAEANADSTEIRVFDQNVTADAPLLMGETALRFSLTGARTWNGVAPFLRLSAGVVADLGGDAPEEANLPEPERFEFGPAFALGLGAGTDIYLARRAAIRVQLDGRLWRLGAPEGFLPRTVESIRKWKNASTASIGGAFFF